MIGYTTVRTIDVHSVEISLPGRFLFLFILLFSAATGVVWEVLEWTLVALEGPLAVDLIGHGPLGDTMEDLTLDLVGGCIGAIVGGVILADGLSLTGRQRLAD